MSSDSTIKEPTASKPLFDKILTICKIAVIAYVSFYLLTNFIPYYEGADAYIFAIAALNLSEGSYSITNELLQATGQWEFVPLHWSKTVFNTSVPNVLFGTNFHNFISYCFRKNSLQSFQQICWFHNSITISIKCLDTRYRTSSNG